MADRRERLDSGQHRDGDGGQHQIGLTLGEVVDLGLVRMVEVKDPDGNHIQALEETGEALG